MIILQKQYANGQTREIAVSSVLSTDDPDSVLLLTASEGEIMLCRLDDASLWAQLEQAGGLPA